MAAVVTASDNQVEVRVVDAAVRVSVEQSITEITLAATGPQGPRGTQVLSGNVNPSSNIGLLGDQYINTNTGKLFGPKTLSGWGEGVTIAGLGTDDIAQVYNQASPSTVWNIAHTLEFVPNITIVDTEGNVVEGEYEYVSDSHIRATFSTPISGSAYLS